MLHCLACLLLVAVQPLAVSGGMIVSSAVSGQYVVLCAATSSHHADMLYTVRDGAVHHNVSMPDDMGTDGFTTTSCAGSGMVADPQRPGIVYVAMANTYGQSTFGSSLVKVDLSKAGGPAIVERLKMPQAGRVPHEEYSDAKVLVFYKDSLLVADHAGMIHRLDLESFTFVDSLALPGDPKSGTYPSASELIVDTGNGFLYARAPPALFRIELTGTKMQIVSRLNGVNAFSQAGQPGLLHEGHLYTIAYRGVGLRHFNAIPRLNEVYVGDGKPNMTKDQAGVGLWLRSGENQFYPRTRYGDNKALNFAAFFPDANGGLGELVVVGARNPPPIIPPHRRLQEMKLPDPAVLLAVVEPLSSTNRSASVRVVADFSSQGYSDIYNIVPASKFQKGKLLAIGSGSVESLLEISMPDFKVLRATELPTNPALLQETKAAKEPIMVV